MQWSVDSYYIITHIKILLHFFLFPFLMETQNNSVHPVIAQDCRGAVVSMTPSVLLASVSRSWIQIGPDDSGAYVLVSDTFPLLFLASSV